MSRLNLFLTFLLISFSVAAQRPGGGNVNLMQKIPGGFMGGNAMGSRGGSSPFKDTLLHRTGHEDSATIAYRFLDTARFYFLDSTVNDFGKRWPVPWTSVFLGNTGSASRSMLFSPNMKPGWDHGFHAYDAYIPDVFDTKFFNTTRPYTQLSYVLGPKSEQTIGVTHTQNVKYNWNFSFRFNLTNAPGIFKNQKTNHTNLHFNTWYVTPNKRYTVYFIAANNKIGGTENGGLKDMALLDSIPAFKERFNLPTNLGGSTFESQTLLSNVINTGNKYTVTNFLLRHHYDLGKKDSITTDSSVVYLFYPRFRFQHTLQFNRYSFQYVDTRVDTAGYHLLYNLTNLPATFSIKDYWQTFSNELAIYSFPDIKNQQQFLKLAAGVENLRADFGSNEPSYTNLSLNGEYRNKTKNRKWDMELSGKLYLAGFNGGDYNVLASLKRLIGQKLGYLTLRFQNVNRSPATIHDDQSNFKKFNLGNTNFKQENTTIASAIYELPQQKLLIAGKYFLAGNYIYFKNYTQAEQEATLFNVLQLQVQKQFSFGKRKRWNWYTEIYFQQTTASAPINVPTILTRNRFAYEGVFFKNLNLSTGVEMRYHTPYKADGYSPVLGQFFLQNTTSIHNRPDIAAYLHFRVRSFSLFIRAENLNTMEFTPSFGFIHNNLATPNQATPGYYLRFGIFWGFVN